MTILRAPMVVTAMSIHADSGCELTCLFARIPQRRSPSFVNATTDGVVLEPSEFSMTFGFLPSIIATHELVVPKSIPITAPFTSVLQVSRGWREGGRKEEEGCK